MLPCRTPANISNESPSSINGMWFILISLECVRFFTLLSLQSFRQLVLHAATTYNLGISIACLLTQPLFVSFTCLRSLDLSYCTISSLSVRRVLAWKALYGMRRVRSQLMVSVKIRERSNEASWPLCQTSRAS